MSARFQLSAVATTPMTPLRIAPDIVYLYNRHLVPFCPGWCRALCAGPQIRPHPTDMALANIFDSGMIDCGRTTSDRWFPGCLPPIRLGSRGSPLIAHSKHSGVTIAKYTTAKSALRRGAETRRRKTEPRAHTTRSGRGGSGVYSSNMAKRHERVNRYSYSREVLAEFGRTQSDIGHRSSSRQRLGLEVARRSGVRSGSSRTVTTTASSPRRRCAALPRAIPRLCRNR